LSSKVIVFENYFMAVFSQLVSWQPLSIMLPILIEVLLL
jgi:hypothetical protein